MHADDPNGGGVLNPIFLCADEISTTLEDIDTTRSLNIRRVHNWHVAENNNIEPLSDDSTWRTTLNYDKVYCHNDHVLNELAAKFEKEERDSLALYNSYCSIQSETNMWKHVIFDRYVPNKQITSVNSEARKYRRDEEINNERNSDEGIDDDDDNNDNDYSGMRLLSAKSFRSTGSNMQTSTPRIYQEGEFTRLSNPRRKSWIDRPLVVEKQTKRTMFARLRGKR